MIEKLTYIVFKLSLIVGVISLVLVIVERECHINSIYTSIYASFLCFIYTILLVLICMSKENLLNQHAKSTKGIRLISVKEALPPDESTKVICLMKSNGEFVSGYIYLNNRVPTIETNPAFEFEDYGNYEVTHWMYIPEIKKGE